MQQVGGGHATGQLPKNVFAFRVHHVGDANHRGGGEGGFIYSAEYHGVTVAIDDARR